MSVVLPDTVIYGPTFQSKLRKLKHIPQIKENDSYSKFIQRRRAYTIEKSRTALENKKDSWRDTIALYGPSQESEKQRQNQRRKIVGMIQAKIQQYN